MARPAGEDIKSNTSNKGMIVKEIRLTANLIVNTILTIFLRICPLS